MSDEIIKVSGEWIDIFLPEALGKALYSYQEFMEQEIPTDVKGFSAHHAAAKVAIAHVELLVKLGKSVDRSKDPQDSQATALMLSKAETELLGYKSRQDVWEQEGEEELS